MKSIERGFTLIELLVVISIIAVLAGVVLGSLSIARENARVKQTAAQLQELRHAVNMYRIDTGQFPPYTCDLSCLESEDPLSTNVANHAGWRGPYFGVNLSDYTHQWGGHLTVGSGNIDTSDSDIEMYVFVDDDAPGTNSNDNSGTIPNDSMQKIDEILDDGNLLTGNLRGLGQFSTAPTGEFIYIVEN